MDNIANTAYSDEYKAYQQQDSWLFELEPKEEPIVYLGENKQYTVRYFTYSKTDVNSDGIECRNSALKVVVTRSDGSILLEYKMYNDDRLTIHLIHHGNGNDYIVFRTDLYGYSVMDIQSGEIVHYMPQCGYQGEETFEETFIWTDVIYCKMNNLLAVDGCYWACPWSYEFYDFSEPMKLPLPMYGDGYELGKEIGMKVDSETAAFDDTGKCIIKGKDENGVPVIKTIDIVEWSKSGK